MTASVSHRTVLLAEAVDALNVVPEGVYVDGTFGRGGHSREILARLGPEGRLLAFDRDTQAVEVAKTWADSRFTIFHAPFSEMRAYLDSANVGLLDGVLLDLGVSSPQLDQAERGFSFRFDAPLDMRMDISRGETVAEWLAHASEQLIGEVIRDYGEERFAFNIAKKIVAARRACPLETTGQLAALVRETVRSRDPGQDAATRTFQALRIYINRELEELALILPDIVGRLRPGGRLAVISFHSLEDRIVKRFMRAQEDRDTLPKWMPVHSDQIPAPLLKVLGKPVRPGSEEVKANLRARSAVLRVAEKLG